MKKLLLCALLAFPATLLAQSNAVYCSDATSLCGSLGEPFPNTSNGVNANPMIDYGCLGSEPNPAWFYLPISQSGNLSFDISQASGDGTPLDVDYICFGPFTSVADGCANAGPENEVGCSYSGSAEEHLDIVNAQVGEYYLLMITNFSNQPGYITVMPSTTATAGAINCNGIHLKAFIDINTNGIQDMGEEGFPFGSYTYEANNDGVEHVAVSQDGGMYIYDELLSSTYDITYTVSPDFAAYYNVASPTYSDVQVMPGSSIITYSFPVTITQPYEDVAVYVIPSSPPMPGFTYTNTIVYTNLGNLPVASGTVTFTKDPSATITTVSEPGATITTTGFELNFTDLGLFESRTIDVVMEVPVIPVVNLDDTMTSTAAITPLAGDVAPDNNFSSNTQVIIGSYDPNDKMESRGRFINIDDFSEEDYLYYTIRFQNTGTAPAFNVRIEDMLDNQLDFDSVEMIRASHSYMMERLDGQLTWRFEDIMLPASQDDEPASHGYIYFRVKPNTGFAVDDIIPNTAEIYFDFNPAIITNTFTSKFVNGLGNESFSSTGFAMYPNPADANVSLTLNNAGATISKVWVRDITGKVIYAQNNLNSGNHTIDAIAFGAGVYIVEITDSANSKTVKKLLVK